MATTAKITSGSTATTLSTEACTSFAPRVFRIPLHRGRTSWSRKRVSGSVRESRIRPERTYMRVISSAAAVGGK